MPIVVGNSLKVTASEVEQLQFLIQNNMQIAGVSVGQCYAQRLSMYSTVFLRPSTLTVTGGTFADAFSYASGATVQNFGGGAATNIVTTDADTNWPSGTNALPVNMMFVGLSFGVDMNICGTGGLPLGPPSTAAQVEQISQSITYKVREGGNIISNYGLLYDYPAGVGTYATGAIRNYASAPAATQRTDIASGLGGPYSHKSNFRVPQLWKPLVSYQHRLTFERTAVLIDGTGGSTTVNENQLSANLMAIRLSWDGYLVTAQV